MAKNNLSFKNLTHNAFEIGIIFKGIDGLLEIAGGILIFYLKPETVSKIIITLTQHELSQDPKDFIAGRFLKFAHNYSVGSAAFGSVFLLSHGIIKLALIVALWRRKLWAYPTAIVFFSAFAVYQMYRFSLSPSFGMIFLTILDILVIWLTVLEYRRIVQPDKNI